MNKLTLIKEIKQTVKNMLALVISLIMINKGMSIAKIFNFTTDERVKWSLDIGIYNAILSVFLGIIYYFFNERKLDININMITKKDDTLGMTIKGDEPEKVSLVIKLKGKYNKKISSKVEISFPYWIDFQLKPKPYITQVSDKNKCVIDLNNLVYHEGKIEITEMITFDIISNTDEDNIDLVQAQYHLDLISKLFKVNLLNNGIEIRNKGRSV